MYYLLGIDDTNSSDHGDTATLALTLGEKMEFLSLARLINISCHQLFQHSSIPHTGGNICCCLLLDSDPLKIREIDMITRLTLRSESTPNANPGYALAAWNQFDPEVVAWAKTAKITMVQRMDAITLARRCDISIAGISGSGAGAIGALAAVGLRFDGNDGYIHWMPGLDQLRGIFTQLEINQFIHFESIESENQKHPALDDHIQFTDSARPIFKNGRVILQVSPAPKGSNFEWQS